MEAPIDPPNGPAHETRVQHILHAEASEHRPAKPVPATAAKQSSSAVPLVAAVALSAVAVVAAGIGLLMKSKGDGDSNARKPPSRPTSRATGSTNRPTRTSSGASRPAGSAAGSRSGASTRTRTSSSGARRSTSQDGSSKAPAGPSKAAAPAAAKPSTAAPAAPKAASGAQPPAATSAAAAEAATPSTSAARGTAASTSQPAAADTTAQSPQAPATPPAVTAAAAQPAAASTPAASAATAAAAAAVSASAAGAAAAAAAAEAAPVEEEPMPLDGEAAEHLLGAGGLDAGAENGDEEGDLIDLQDLQEGETLPVVDEDGNELGQLQQDGRVVNAEGKVIGAVNEEGQVVLYAEGQEPVQLSADEEQAEQLMRQAAVSWNLHNNRAMAVKLQKKALEVVQQGQARQEIVAEVASSLADMLYATDSVEEARDAVIIAMDAAEATSNYPLFIKLSNNMGAVLRKLERHEEAKELHTKALDMALTHYGKDHATATLARGNLVETLDTLGDTEAARQLLVEYIEDLLKMAEEKEAEAPEEQQAPPQKRPKQAAPGEPEEEEEEETPEEKAAELRWRPRRAATRAYIELARLELKSQKLDEAFAVLNKSIDMATDKFGSSSPETSSLIATLATAHRQSGNVLAAAEAYKTLYEANASSPSPNVQNGVVLAQAASSLFTEAEKWTEAMEFAQKALDEMQAVIGQRVHPYLEPFFNALIEAKTKAGDTAGADETRRAWLKGMTQFRAAAARQQAGPGRGVGGRGMPQGARRR